MKIKTEPTTHHTSSGSGSSSSTTTESSSDSDSESESDALIIGKTFTKPENIFVNSSSAVPLNTPTRAVIHRDVVTKRKRIDLELFRRYKEIHGDLKTPIKFTVPYTGEWRLAESLI